MVMYAINEMEGNLIEVCHRPERQQHSRHHEIVNLSTSTQKIAHTRDKYITLKLINFSNLDASQLISSSCESYISQITKTMFLSV
jgi:hypothetical protein